MIDSVANEKKDTPTTVRVEDFLIHTMPKRFINVKNQDGFSHKGTGVLILGIGGIILIIGLIFVYFYVIKPGFSLDKSNVAVKTVLTDENDTEKSKNKSELATTSDSSALHQSEIAIQASTSVGDLLASSADGSIMASGSEEIATTTTEIVADSAETLKNVPAPDADSDGLSDAEESFLGTDKSSADSDSDGYGDLSELLSLHNPTGKGRLLEDQKILKFVNRPNAYNIYYPSAWSVSESLGSTVFKIGELQFIQVIVSENTKSQTLGDWYKEQAQTSEIQDSQKFEKKGWTGIRSRDGLIVYLSNSLSSNIYTLNYNPGENETFLYQNIFQMMVNSLELGQ